MKHKILIVYGMQYETAINVLTNAKVIASIPYKHNQWLVARWGVSKRSLMKRKQELLGEK